MTSPQQSKAQKDEQARRQSAGTPRQRSVSVSQNAESPLANDTALNAKRVSAVMVYIVESIQRWNISNILYSIEDLDTESRANSCLHGVVSRS
jgi:hypothetical protein